MTDFARLGIVIDNSEIEEAEAALGQLGPAGEAAAKRINAAWQKVNSITTARRELDQLKAALSGGATPLQQFQKGLDRLDAREATSGMFALRAGLTGLATEAIGTSGALARLGESFIAFGLSGGVGLTVLAGIAAIGLAVKAFSHEETDAEKAAQALTKALADQYLQGLGPMQKHAQDLATVTETSTEALKTYQAQAANAAWVRAAGDNWDFISMAVAKFFVDGTDEAGTWDKALEGLRAKHAALVALFQIATPDQAIKDGAAAAQKFTTAYDDAQAKLAEARTAFEHATSTTAALADAVEFTRLKWQGYSDTQAALIVQTDRQTASIRKQADALHALSEEFRTAPQLIPIGPRLQGGKPQPEIGGLPGSFGVGGRPLNIPGLSEDVALDLKDHLVALGVDPDSVQRILEQYAQGFNSGFSDFFKGIETDGVAHFQNLFAAIRDMYAQLISDLAAKKLTNALGSTVGAKGIEDIGAGLVGFSAGQSGGVGSGILSGALAGALIPGGGPVTAILGAVGGLIGGLLGDAQDAERAAQQLHEARVKFGADLQAFADAANGTATSLTQAVQQVQAEAEQLRQEALATHGSTAGLGGADELAQAQAELAALQAQRAQVANGSLFAKALDAAIAAQQQEIAALEQINGLEGTRITQLQQEAAQLRAFTIDSYAVRLLRAKGESDQADTLALQLQQQQEYNQAVQDGADAAQLAALMEVQLAETRRAALDKLQSQITSLTTTIDDLAKFQTDLKLGGLTGLSPTQQLQAAREQYQQVVAQAEAGSQTAAQELPNVAQAFLQASRAVNASGGRYQADFTTVLSDAAQVQQLFEGQRTAAQAQVDLLQSQLDAMKDIATDLGIVVSGHIIPDRSPTDILQRLDTLTETVQALVGVSQAGFLQMIAAQEGTTQAVEITSTSTRLALEGLAV